MPERTQVDALADPGQHGEVIRPAAVQVVEDDLPGGRGKHLGIEGRGELGVPLGAAAGQRVGGRSGTQQAVAVRQHDLALVLDELVVAEGIPVDLQVGALGDALRVPHGRVCSGVADAAVRIHIPRRLGVRGVGGDQLVLQADEEHRAAGVTLPAGPSPQLVVEPAAHVPPGTDHVQPAEPGDLIAVAVVSGASSPRASTASAEADVGAAAGHLRRHGDRAERARLGHDRGLLCVVLRVEDDAGQAGRGEPLRQPLRFGDVEGADQDRPPGGVCGGHLPDDRVLFLLKGRVQPVGLVLPNAGPVRRDHRDLDSSSPTVTAVPVMPQTRGYRRIRDSTVMLSRISPLSVAARSSFASTAACRPSGHRCISATRPREALIRWTLPSRTI